jgi:aminoglycoside phosphotransferase (APT) family kinase protein
LIPTPVDDRGAVDGTAGHRKDELPEDVLRWVQASVASSAIVGVTTMSQSGTGSPWRLDLTTDDGERALVLKAEPPAPDVRRRFATAAEALAFAAANDVPAPRPVDHDLEAESGWLASLTTLLPGTSSIAADIGRSRLRALGAEAARIHLVPGEPTPDLPLRSRALDGYDLNADTSPTPSTPLLERAREVIARGSPAHDEPVGFVDGDYWQGNTLWAGDRYTGAVDWDFAGFGAAGVDLGSLRADVVVLHGPDAAAAVLAGWEEAAGRPAPNRAWWDLVAGVSTPEDMRGWLPNFHAQGRTDLDLETVTRRRDDHLERALREVG